MTQTALALVEADLDEVVAGAERAEVVHVLPRSRASGASRRSLVARPRARAQRVATDAGGVAPRAAVARARRCRCGRAAPRASIAERSAARLSGRSFAGSVVCTAIMPQPMSTPTAAGMIAPLVGITLPTVAPMPKCTSGITATCWKTKGSARGVAQLPPRLVLDRHAARPHLDGALRLPTHQPRDGASVARNQPRQSVRYKVSKLRAIARFLFEADVMTKRRRLRVGNRTTNKAARLRVGNRSAQRESGS